MKVLLKKLLPPILLEIKRKMFSKNVPNISPEKFSKWWTQYSPPLIRENNISKDLTGMVDHFITTETFSKASGYWLYLCMDHIKLLVAHGVKNFKQNIEKIHYWGEASIDSRLIQTIINNPVHVEIDTQMIFKQHEYCSITESVQHNIANVMLLNYIFDNKLHGYLELMEEPKFGNPITISYNNKNISFALLNSIIEVDVILKNIECNEGHSFLELGAGSGRTCIAMCKAKENVKYVICDIPPALYISQENVSREFPEKDIFRFRVFESFDDIKEDFLSADIRFITPDQLELIPDKLISTSIAIDCLHEMTNESVVAYFEQFNRISDTLYFKSQVKQWADTSRKSLDIDTYPIRDNWSKILHERSVIPNDYFNAIYKM